MIWLCMSITDANSILNSLSRKMSLYIDCLDTNVENLFSKLASLAGALRSFGGACCGLASFAFALTSWLSRYSSRSSRSSRSSMVVSKFGSSIFVISSTQRTHIDSSHHSQFGQRGKISIIPKRQKLFSESNFEFVGATIFPSLRVRFSFHLLYQPTMINLASDLCWSLYHLFRRFLCLALNGDEAVPVESEFVDCIFIQLPPQACRCARSRVPTAMPLRYNQLRASMAYSSA